MAFFMVLLKCQFSAPAKGGQLIRKIVEVPKKFHVALSFVGEDRVYVDAVAKALQAEGVDVFYDKFEEVDLWGKDLYTHHRSNARRS